MTKHYWATSEGQDLQQFRDSLQQQQQQQKVEVEKLKQEVTNKQQQSLEKTFNAMEKQQEAKQSGNTEAAQKAEQAKIEAQAAKAELEKAQDKLAQAEQKAKETSELKSAVSQNIGENYGHQFCTEKLGYQTILHEDSKTIKQGFDSVYYDPKTQETVVMEFKGQDSRLSEQQKNISWTPEVADKVLAREGNYKGSSDTEWQTAKQVKDAYSQGELRYEVVRTKVENGQLYSELEKTTRPMESAEKRQEGSDFSSKHDNKPQNYQTMDQLFGVQKQTNTETTTQSQTETYSQSHQG